jgi:hypothetical protein
MSSLLIDREELVPEDDGGHALFWTSGRRNPGRHDLADLQT